WCYNRTHSADFFFFQAEDGIRDRNVTGVQTCALPIYGGRGGPRAWARGRRGPSLAGPAPRRGARSVDQGAHGSRGRGGALRARKIGRASCRERGEMLGGGGCMKKKKKERNVAGYERSV